MRLRNILLFAFALVIILMNVIYGNAISWFLSVCIVGSILYYIFQMYFEKQTLTSVRNAGADTNAMLQAAGRSKRVRAMASFVLMTILYIAAVIAIRNVSMPREDKPYFYNNEYHAISNTGIHFGAQLSLQTKEDLENEAKLSFIPTANAVQVKTQNYFTPIFVQTQKEGEYALLNKIYPQKIKKSLSWSNDKTQVKIEIEKDQAWYKKLLGASPKALYKVQIQSSESELYGEQSAQINDEFTFQGPWLKKGMSLYNIMFEQDIIDAPGPEAMQVLQEMMQEIGKSLLIADVAKEENGFYFFPSKAFIDKGFKVKIDEQVVAPQTNGEWNMPLQTPFYLGFHNVREKMSLSIAKSGQALLAFDHAPKYWLSVPAEQQVLNNKCQAFLTNDFDQVIEGKGKEGFFFNNFGLMTDANFEGRMNYLIGKPTDDLAFSIQDLKGKDGGNNKEKTFELKTDNPNISYAFEIRDFSDNGFSFSNMLLYAAFVYLGFLFVLIFFPGKDLGRIEPVIFTVIFGLFIVRMLMYWRLATFPPLENISKFELENTILNFDFNFITQLPIPLTVIWLYLFLVVLVVFRKFGTTIKSYYKNILDQKLMGSKRSVYKAFGLVMLSLFIINVLNNKILGIDVLTRVLEIILPLVLYLLFTNISNQKFKLEQKWVEPKDSKFIKEVKAYLYYYINNPAFIISGITFTYFAITDRGFAILFMLFLILKNILFSFLKKGYNSERTSFLKMLYKPNNYWIYGFVALVLYFVVLAVKSFFYYVLLYYMWIVGAVLLLFFLFLYLFFRKEKRWLQVSGGAFLFYLILVAIPFTRNGIDKLVTAQIKHVQYRVSILNQPIAALLAENDYTSFSTQKIIETAENQWFINSYISKAYDNSKTLNLRPYNRVGVNYNTQTRDVVLARFVIGEMGNITMYLLLILCFVPLLVYLLSFEFKEEGSEDFKINTRTYPGAVPLILFFTISLFVWLTSTNRFVFFGQDFPFLSLTSKISVILPLLLLGYALIQQPKARSSETVNLKSGFTRYALFAGLIAFFALITVTPNTLNSNNFSVVVDKTQSKINQELNTILNLVQDSISVNNSNFTYLQMIRAVKENEQFKNFYENSLDDPYTKSIVKGLVDKPYSAFQVNSPLYIQYDGYRYTALYNQHFYLELPAVDNEEVWHGNVAQIPRQGEQKVSLLYGEQSMDIAVPSIRILEGNNVQIAFLPKSWLANSTGNVAILDRAKSENPWQLFVFKDVKKAFEQKSTSFAVSITANDLAAIEKGAVRTSLQFEDQSQIFAFNKWVNGKYKIIYPQRPKNMWMYHFAQSIKEIYDKQEQYRGSYYISLDYGLNKKLEQVIHNACAARKSDNRYKFTAIAADGNGNVQLMQDFVVNRKVLDPNDQYSIQKLKQDFFFFSKIRNTRDQWGEANSTTMMLGPGSSVKPLIASIVASQVNAGWENLVLNGVAGDQNSYAGFKMVKPWKKEHQDGGSFNLSNYISSSSNFYQSLMIFLGSYPKAAFVKNGKASLANILTTSSEGNNTFPSLSFNGSTMYLSAYNKGKNNWPRTNYQDEKKKTYFGNENSLLSNGLEVNANLITKEKSKDKKHVGAYDRINLIDSVSYQLLAKNGSSNFLWSMPEESTFLQSLRAPKEIHQNVMIGLKTTTLGGFPYQLSSFKMLEMYGSMATQNRAYRLHLDDRKLQNIPWFVDSTWQGNSSYNQFFASNIMQGMANATTAGTARSLAKPNGSFYYYAKTGTINEQGSGVKSSKRLVVIVSDKDLTQVANIGNAKVYLFYFAEDRAGSGINWSLVNQIIAETMKSTGFKNYFAS